MKTKLRSLLAKLRQDERGLSTVEYVVLLVLIVAVAVAMWNVFGQQVTGKLNAAATQFNQEVQTTKSGKAEAATGSAVSGNAGDLGSAAPGGGGGGTQSGGSGAGP
jgi:Flp pilus assembly pilin Flp